MNLIADEGGFPPFIIPPKKSEGWSVSQKEAIRELFETLINCGFTYGWKEINPIPDDKFEEAIKYGFDELEAITKGKEPK